MSLVSSDQLEKWGITFEEAFAVGLQTLRECTVPRFREDNGVYTGTWNDDYDSTRILVPGVFDDLPIQGDPIVVLPNRLTLLVADSDNHDAVRRMLAQAEEIISKVPRAQNPGPLRVREGLVEDYVVGEDSPVFEAVQRAHSLAALTYYADQQQMLEKYYQKTGKDLFVATHNLRQHNDGRYVSHAVWTKDVPTLLPDADLIAFVDSDRPEGQRGLGFVPRTKVIAVMGEQMLDTKMFPRRDFVSGFPNEEQLRELGIA